MEKPQNSIDLFEFSRNFGAVKEQPAKIIFRQVTKDFKLHGQAEFRKLIFFPLEIFRSPNRFSESVRDAESHGIKILTRFPGNPILGIFIKICNCVGYTNMRGRFLLKVGLIALFNCSVILRYFLVWVYLILSEPTQF